MIDQVSLINNYTKELHQLTGQFNIDQQHIQSFSFTTHSLDDYLSVDIRKSKEWSPLFKDLLQNKNRPVLYWITFKNNDLDKVRAAISNYMLYNGERKTPALRKNTEKDSNCLYVGKVKRNFWGRVIQHLGYGRSKRTQGLQLYHWAKPLKLHLQVSYLYFPQAMSEIISMYELIIAQQMQPIIGRH